MGADPRKTLDELFERAGIRRGNAPAPSPLSATERNAPTEQEVRAERRGFDLRRELLALKFAQLYVKHNFSLERAYREMNPKTTRPRTKRRERDWARRWIADPRVLAHIRAIVQDATNVVQDMARVGIDQLLELNEMVILNDVTGYYEEQVTRDFDESRPPGQQVIERTTARFKALRDLSLNQRMAIKSITLDEEGRIRKIVPYDAQKAKALHVALLAILQREGGNDQGWHSQFKQRMTQARERRIALEVARGKVIRLPAPKERGNG